MLDGFDEWYSRHRVLRTTQKEERNWQIIKARMLGKSYAVIAREHGVTGNTIRSMCFHTHRKFIRHRTRYRHKLERSVYQMLECFLHQAYGVYLVSPRSGKTFRYRPVSSRKPWRRQQELFNP